MFSRCPNRDCPGRRWQLLKHFAGAMDIDGLGEKQVDLFMRLGWVRAAGDFYRLTVEQIAKQPGFGEVSANKLVTAIAASRRQPFGRVLFAAGIEEVGDVTGRNLAMRFRSLDALLSARRGRDRGDPGSRVEEGSGHSRPARPSPRCGALLEDLQREGLTLTEDGPAPGEGPLAQRMLVLTGTLPQLTPRGGDRADPRRWWPRYRLGVQEDRLPGRRRQRRLQAHPAPEKLGEVVVDEAGLRALLAGEAPGPRSSRRRRGESRNPRKVGVMAGRGGEPQGFRQPSGLREGGCAVARLRGASDAGGRRRPRSSSVGVGSPVACMRSARCGRWISCRSGGPSTIFDVFVGTSAGSFVARRRSPTGSPRRR